MVHLRFWQVDALAIESKSNASGRVAAAMCEQCTPRATGAMRYRLLRALMMPFAPHAPSCSDGTALKWAVKSNKADVIAFLRSVGAPE